LWPEKLSVRANDYSENTYILLRAGSRFAGMKISASILASAAFLGLTVATVSAAPKLPVQEVAETTTTTSGTISDFGTDRMVIHTKTSRTPLGYTFTKTTTYVDENGTPVAFETVKSGLPVTVYYTKDGDRMVASKVVVRRTPAARGASAVVEEHTIAGTNMLGTVSEFGADDFFIKADGSPAPVRYLYSKKTIYVDENGKPVAVGTVKSGVPVTVYFTREGDRMNATRVIVRKASPPAGVIIQKKTTTVTEESK